jgi:hypothetical protein
LTTFWHCSTRYCRKSSVAAVMAKAALFEQLAISSSAWMIFLTLATVGR